MKLRRFDMSFKYDFDILFNKLAEAKEEFVFSFELEPSAKEELDENLRIISEYLDTSKEISTFTRT